MPGVQGSSVTAEPRRLSSRWTPIMRALPTLVLIPILLVNSQADVRIDGLYFRSAILGAVLWIWWTSRLRRVGLDGDTLIVAHRRLDVRVPLSSVTSVRCCRWLNTKDVTIKFDRDFVFGREATFMPRTALLGGWDEHPIAEELRRLAGLSAHGG